MGKLRKIGKKIGKGIKSVGRKLKKGFGKIAKAFGKLGPLGTIALSFIIPGVGSWISGIAEGSSFLQPLAQGLVNAGNFVKDGVGRVFNRVTDAIEYSMNKVSNIVPGSEGQFGTNFRNWVSDTTNGFIEKSEAGLELETAQFDSKLQKAMDKNLGKFDGSSYAEIEKGVFEFRDAQDKVIETIKSPEVIRNETLAQINDKPSIFKKQEDIPFRQKVLGSKEFDVYKKIQPITAMGANIQAQQDAEAFEAEQARLMKQEYFQEAGMSLLASGSANPNISFIDFTNPNPSPTELFNLQNSYSGILS